MFTITDPFTGEETVLAGITVQCESAGCGNAGVAFTVPEGSVQCGACGEWIVAPAVDVPDPQPAPDPEEES